MVKLSLLCFLVNVCSLSIIGVTAWKQECTREMDLVFVVDHSGSICGDLPVHTCESWKALIAFMRALINDMVIGDKDVRVGMVEYGSIAEIKWNLTTYHDKSAMFKSLDSYNLTGGNTNTIAALGKLSDVFSAARGDRPEAQNVAVLITDGKPKADGVPYPMDQIRAAVKKVTDQHIQLIAVGVTKDIDNETLREMSSSPHRINETVFFVDNYKNLGSILKQLEIQTCRTVEDPRVEDIIPACSEKLDLCFVIDGSGSICDNQPDFKYENPQHKTCKNWEDTLTFMQSIAAYFNIGLNETRIGLVEFPTTAIVRWGLTKYTDRSSLLNAIKGLKYNKGEHTDMTGGLRLMRTQVFGGSGDRSDVPNVAIIISDGYPTNSETLPAEIDAVRLSGIRTLSVGVTNLTDEKTIKSLATPPQKLNYNYFMAREFVDLKTFRQTLDENACKPSH